MKKGKLKTLVSNILYFLLCTLMTKLIGYIILPVVTDSMTVEQYGTADLIMSIINFLYPITGMGLSSAVLRYVMDEEIDTCVTFTSALKLICVSSILSFALIPLLQNYSEISNYVLYIPIIMSLYNAIAIVSSLCKGNNRTHVLVVQNVVYGCSLLLLVLTLVKEQRRGIDGYFLSYCLANAVALIVLWIGGSASKYVYHVKEWKEARRFERKLLEYGLPLVPNSLAWWITQMSDRFMVTYWHGAAANGLYAVAYKIPSIFNAFIAIFTQAWQLSAIENYKKKDSVAFYNTVYRYYCAACYIAGACVILFTKVFAEILFANEFYQAWCYVPLLVLAAVIGSQEQYMGTFYLANNHTKKYFTSSVIGAVINIVLNFFFVPTYAAWGATIATIISYLIVYSLRVYDIRKMIGLDVAIFKNTICMIIVLVQAIIHIYDQQYVYCMSLGCIIVLLLIFKKDIVGILNSFKFKRSEK